MSPTCREISSAPGGGCGRFAFTLVELMIVITIIILVITAATPSIMRIFTAGSDAQAYNVLVAQLTAARALAIRKATHAGVHVQIADNPRLSGKCFSAVVWDDPTTDAHLFSIPSDYFPRRIPGGMAFSQIPRDSSDPPEDYTNFTIVFSPTGAAVKYVYGEEINFDGDAVRNPAFAAAAGSFKWLWNVPWNDPDDPSDQAGAVAVSIFNYSEAMSSSNFGAYVAANQSPPIPLNYYTGQLFPKERL